MFAVTHKSVARMLERSLVAASLAIGLALVMAPAAKAGEIGLGYRKSEVFNGQVESTQWPVTASVWLKPTPMFYLGGGVGWYNTTLHYPNTPALASYTSQKTGMHLGGGMSLPLVPGIASADLNLRYVYLGTEKSQLPPQNFKADYFTAALGCAIHF